VLGCVVEVVAPTVVDVDDRVVGARVGGGTGVVDATLVGTVDAGTVPGVVSVVVVETGAIVVTAAAGASEVDVVLAVVDAGTTDDSALVVDAASVRLANFTRREPPGGPASTSAPVHSAAKPISAMHPRHASHERC
jgi:hypothetical protein